MIIGTKADGNKYYFRLNCGSYDEKDGIVFAKDEKEAAEKIIKNDGVHPSLKDLVKTIWTDDSTNLILVDADKFEEVGSDGKSCLDYVEFNSAGDVDYIDWDGVYNRINYYSPAGIIEKTANEIGLPSELLYDLGIDVYDYEELENFWDEDFDGSNIDWDNLTEYDYDEDDEDDDPFNVDWD